MNEIEKFKSAIKVMVEKCLPDESVAFELAGEDQIKKVFKSQGDASASSTKEVTPQKSIEDFEFLFEAKTVIEFVGLIIGTFELYQWFSKRLKETKQGNADKQNLTRRWKDELLKAGLSEEKAELVAIRCSADVLELLQDCQ